MFWWRANAQMFMGMFVSSSLSTNHVVLIDQSGSDCVASRDVLWAQFCWGMDHFISESCGGGWRGSDGDLSNFRKRFPQRINWRKTWSTEISCKLTKGSLCKSFRREIKIVLKNNLHPPILNSAYQNEMVRPQELIEISRRNNCHLVRHLLEI